ncbi:MAG: DEAD/DEAH box helicase [Phycisphaerales bacterium]|nr:DEAD/DEAH box helicase [Phycisphaerales bacterium]
MDTTTLRHRLSRLSYAQAAKLLGADGKYRLSAGSARYQIGVDLEEAARWDGDEQLSIDLDGATVTVSLSNAHTQRLAFCCSMCGDHDGEEACEHIAAVLSIILEEKLLLGLAKPPKERVAVENLSDEELVKRALAEREERAKTERMRVTRPDGSEKIWGDYAVTNPASGKTYRVALRGRERGESYCDCPDFRKNTLGTCKHIMRVLSGVKRKGLSNAKPWRPTGIEVYLHYAAAVPELRLNLPEKLDGDASKIVAVFRGKVVEDVAGFVKVLRRLAAAGIDVTVFPDAMEHIQRRLFRIHMAELTAAVRKDPKNHPLRKTLLKTELLPYQMDGIAFAAGAGRAILADDMGLGKTIQGVGVAELLAREANIRKVLIVCPASLKAQWKLEIERFSDRDVQLVQGAAKERAALYAGMPFFTICNYEQTLRDLDYIEKAKWDLIILDEAQRIKNWEAATTRIVKSLKSTYALALTGTPMENRLEELYTVATFVDEHRLGPAFRFLNTHLTVDDKGHVLGYKNIGDLRERLKPILLRRTRNMVMSELPPRHTEVIRVEPSEEQAALHYANMQIVRQVTNKAFISEMDMLRLRRALLMCRLSANGTYLVDKQEPNYSTKMQALEELLERLLAEDGRKIILFSEWTTMLDLIKPVLEKLLKGKRDFVRLDGSIPQTKRQALVNRFQKHPECVAFLSTNAGSTGLNLQAANTIINVDLPWNPAVLEQRIGRAHRMGQKRPVQVYLLVTADTLEEKLLSLLGTKRDLALAALDPESDVDMVNMRTGMDELKSRMEVLLGPPPTRPLDMSMATRKQKEAEDQARRERVRDSGGKLLSAALDFLGELLSQAPTSNSTAKPTDDATKPVAANLGEQLRSALSHCITRDETGNAQLRIPLSEAVLDKFTSALEAMLSRNR